MGQKKKSTVLRIAALAFLLLVVTIPGTVRAEGTQKAETDVQIKIYGNRKNVEFQVKGEDGKAVNGASIEIRNGKAEWLFYGTTDISGRKALWMPLSTQTYRVYKSGYETVQGSFKVKNLLSRVVVKVTLKKTKTEKPKPDPTPKPTPKPEKPSGGSTGGNGSFGGNSTSTGGVTGLSGGSGTESSSDGSSDSSPGSDGSEGNASGQSEENTDTGETKSLKEEVSPGTEEKNTEREKAAEERVTEETARSMEQIDLGINVYRTDGTPASGLRVELHSKVLTGKLDEKGFILFPGVTMGNHVLYAKNAFGITVAQKAFNINRSNITTLENDGTVTVGIAVAEVTVNVEYSENGSMRMKSAWEGLTDGSGGRIAKEASNRANQAESNLFLRLVTNIWIWLVIILLLIIILFRYYYHRKKGKR